MNKLVQAIKSGNRAKAERIFEQIYYRYCRLVAFVISKYVYSPHDVEELTDDVFVALSREASKTDIRNVKYFLVVCAKNAAVNFVRRNSGGQVTYAESISQDELSQVAATRAAPFWELVSELRQVLSLYETEVVLLRAVYGYTFQELSVRYGKPSSTVRTTFNRAVKKCKKGEILL